MPLLNTIRRNRCFCFHRKCYAAHAGDTQYGQSDIVKFKGARIVEFDNVMQFIVEVQFYGRNAVKNTDIIGNYCIFCLKIQLNTASVAKVNFPFNVQLRLRLDGSGCLNCRLCLRIGREFLT